MIIKSNEKIIKIKMKTKIMRDTKNEYLNFNSKNTS